MPASLNLVFPSFNIQEDFEIFYFVSWNATVTPPKMSAGTITTPLNTFVRMSNCFVSKPAFLK